MFNAFYKLQIFLKTKPFLIVCEFLSTFFNETFILCWRNLTLRGFKRGNVIWKCRKLTLKGLKNGNVKWESRKTHRERFAIISNVFSGGTVFVPHQIGAGVELRLRSTNYPEIVQTLFVKYQKGLNRKLGSTYIVYLTGSDISEYFVSPPKRGC
jgi:hypothetical protein